MNVPVDFKVVYSEGNGSVPPEYHRSREITVAARGQSQIVQRQGYANMPGSHSYTQTLQVTPDRLNALYQTIVKHRVFKRRWEDNARQPLGGSCNYLSITANAKSIVIPCHIPKALQGVREDLIAAVLNIVQAQPEN